MFKSSKLETLSFWNQMWQWEIPEVKGRNFPARNFCLPQVNPWIPSLWSHFSSCIHPNPWKSYYRSPFNHVFQWQSDHHIATDNVSFFITSALLAGRAKGWRWRCSRLSPEPPARLSLVSGGFTAGFQRFQRSARASCGWKCGTHIW